MIDAFWTSGPLSYLFPNAGCKCKPIDGVSFEYDHQEFTRRSFRAKFAERERFKELEFKQAEAHASMWFGVVTAETMDMVKNDADKAERAGSPNEITWPLSK